MKNFKGHLLTLVLVFSFFISLSHCNPLPKRLITQSEEEIEDYSDEETPEADTVETKKEKLKPSKAQTDAEAEEEEDEVKEDDSEDQLTDEFEPFSDLDDEYATEDSSEQDEEEDQMSLLKILLEQQNDD